MSQIKAKRRTTFGATVTLRQADGVTPIDLTGFTVTAEVESGDFSQAITATVTNAAQGIVALSATATQTADWPVTAGRVRMFCDIKQVQGATVRRSPTFEIVVEKEITD